MNTIQYFPAKTLWSVSFPTYNNRMRKVTCVAAQYDEAGHGFNIRAISPEGVMGQYQKLWFDSEDMARDWAERNCESLGFEVEDIMIGRNSAGSSNMYWKIPLKNYPQGHGWVNTYKFDPDVCPRDKMDKLVRLCPEYFSGYDGFETIGDDDDEDIEVTNEPESQEPETTANGRRGFSFNR